MSLATPSLEVRGQAALPQILLSGMTVSEAAEDDFCLVSNWGQGLQKHSGPLVSPGK